MLFRAILKMIKTKRRMFEMSMLHVERLGTCIRLPEEVLVPCEK